MSVVSTLRPTLYVEGQSRGLSDVVRSFVHQLVEVVRLSGNTRELGRAFVWKHSRTRGRQKSKTSPTMAPVITQNARP
jgi:hypothetical protein